jgi:DNA polymerase III subunit epsilon
MSATMYVTLRDLKDRGVRIVRPRSRGAIFNPIGG